jgi:hypothetical protein
MTTILVAGAIANKHKSGGEVWVRLQWALGLARLGFDVCLVEQIRPETCVDAAGQPCDFRKSENLAFFDRVTNAFGLSGDAALLLQGTDQCHGIGYEELLDRADDAALLVNISGHLTDGELRRRVRKSAYIDLDPGFTQFWHISGHDGARLARHDAYFTVGENIGTPYCPIPTGGIPWRPVRQPVLLDLWPVMQTDRPDRFTTVASWRGPFGPIEHDGRRYGLKVHEFRKFRDLPRRCAAKFEIALDIHPADEPDRRLMAEAGWTIVNPRSVAATPHDFQRYVQGSSAEFSVAQGIYVETGSGWFSDRSVYYLASGKPVLVQDTGFSRNLTVGHGLLAYSTMDEALEGTDRIRLDYDRHCRAAREVAQSFFDSDKVLTLFLEQLDLAPCTMAAH